MWRGLRKPGEIHRITCIASPATARWVLSQLDAPRSIADVHGILLSICDAKVAEWPLSWPKSDMAIVNVDYFVPVPKPVDKRKAWLEKTGPHFNFLTR
jgi:hypothetical protein